MEKKQIDRKWKNLRQLAAPFRAND
ncbi:uncharacterized protein G2W53_007166 [Senna tora]|uniref:Uncharacterized protein n=1 Tax=Senna tora TaxID=362788 RepID=A0A834X6M2_9FABA|nr:uncharacterized protein G2W53_007166 [Senna tora]